MSLILSGTDGLSDVDGTAATPAIRGTDANTGIFFPTADTIAFSEGGAEAARFDSSGNLGIGTTSPATKLHVNTTTGGVQVRASSDSDVSFSAVATAVDSTAFLTVINDARQWTMRVNGAESDQFQLRDSTAGANRLVVDSSGNVGIGTNSPLRLLQVGAYGVTNGEIALGATTTGYNSILFGDGATGSDFYRGYVQYNHTSDAMLFATAAAECMRIDSSGNLGIGTTSPGARLQVLGFGTTGQGAANTYTLMYESTTQGNGAGLWFGGMSTENTGVIGSTTATGNIAFQTYNGGWGERMRLTYDGNLLVGTTNASGTAGIGFKFLPYATYSRTSQVGSTTSNSDTTHEVYSTGASAYRFYVGYGGTVFATSITISAISDERLKENVRDIDTGLNSIMSLKPRRFDWKEGKGQDKKNVAGFIAQEFETIFPECVSTSKAGADGIEYKNINHETLIPTLVKAIQEQQTLITQLTARITALETP